MEIFGYDVITKKEFEKLCENENNELNELYNRVFFYQICFYCLINYCYYYKNLFLLPV